jgi:hypothetical protein
MVDQAGELALPTGNDQDGLFFPGIEFAALQAENLGQ